jgi:DNA-binding response OmpR family regulator
MGKRVLLIDDEASIIKMVSKRLELAGYEVLTAMNGRDGLSKAQLGAPDVVILDLMMPQMSGFEVCAALKKDPKYAHIPIIIFTGKGQEMDERLCRELGANAYITKPHQAGALIEMIEVLLRNVLQDKLQEPPPQP